MRVNIARRMTEDVTVVHLSEGVWASQTVQGAWQVVTNRSVGTDGVVTFADSLRVQIPEDQGAVDVALGDWVVRGAWEFSGDAKALRASLPEGSRRVSSIKDRRGGITGANDSVTRYASVLVLECK